MVMNDFEKLISEFKLENEQKIQDKIEREQTDRRKLAFLEANGIKISKYKIGYFHLLHSYKEVPEKFLFFNYISKDFYAEECWIFDELFEETVKEMINRNEL